MEILRDVWARRWLRVTERQTHPVACFEFAVVAFCVSRLELNAVRRRLRDTTVQMTRHN